MKKTKMLGLILALAIVLQTFAVCPVVAATDLAIDALPGQLDEVEYPQTADKCFSDDQNYQFVGYYQVTPLTSYAEEPD